MAQANAITFEIPGRPVTFRRPLNRKGGGRFNPSEMATYRDKVKVLAKAATARPFTGPVNIEIVLYTWGRGDLDNYAKAILDGLKAIAFVGDDQAQVRRLAVERILTPAKADARAVVTVYGNGDNVTRGTV